MLPPTGLHRTTVIGVEKKLGTGGEGPETKKHFPGWKKKYTRTLVKGVGGRVPQTASGSRRSEPLHLKKCQQKAKGGSKSR